MVEESEAPVPPVARKRFVRGRRQMYMQIVAATVILACGVIIGAGATLLHFEPDIVRNPLPPRPDILREMKARYRLTEEQAQKIDVILKESRERMRTFFEEMGKKRDAEFKELSAALKDILTPEQYERWQDDSQRRMRRGPSRFGGKRPGPGDGPGPGGHRPPDWRSGPGGGRGGRGRGDPNDRRDRQGFQRRPPRPPAEPNSHVE